MSQLRAGYRFHLQSATLFTLLCAIVSWLIVAESSPLSHYFLWHAYIPNLFRTLHTVPLIAAILAGSNVHQPNPAVYFAAAAVQWFAVGFALSFAIVEVRQGLRRNGRSA